jgi:hypothetical protein
MRESRSYGSARGVAGDRYPYRDPSFSPAPDSASPKPVQAAVPNTLTHPVPPAGTSLSGCRATVRMELP